MKPLVEICCDGVDAARKAVWRGARRIELCADLPCGGITPAFTDIFSTLNLGVPVNVLIRPRSGDFVLAVRLKERDATLPQMNAAFAALWRMAAEAGGVA